MALWSLGAAQVFAGEPDAGAASASTQKAMVELMLAERRRA
jgi:hypothetical protein